MNACRWIGIAALVLTCGNSAAQAAGLLPASGVSATRGSTDRAASCPGEGPRLPITGICAGRAVAYPNVTGGWSPEAPDGCAWVVQETPLATSVLLYRAVRCGRQATRLVFQQGPGLGRLSYASAAAGEAEAMLKGQVVVSVGEARGKDEAAAVLAIARNAMSGPAERRRCRVRKANDEYLPEDALVVDWSAKAVAGLEEPRSKVCGPFGFEGDASSFWRVFQGHAWYFDLGQDAWLIDPGSFTLLTRNDQGAWIHAR